jgi:cytochrome b subunit of formate dehydrogenase
MSKSNVISSQTRNNWLIDAAVFVSALIASLSGIYFLFLPSGGYQGGRNPWYGVTILFDRHTWDDLHTWTGVAMIAAVVIHFAIHWKWVVSMATRIVKELTGQCACMNARGRFNVALDALVGVSFLIAAVSGVYFMFVPGGSHGVNATTGFLFANTTWDMLHTWSGVAMIVAAVIHFAIHWRWVVNVTKKFFVSLRPQPQASKLSLA